MKLDFFYLFIYQEQRAFRWEWFSSLFNILSLSNSDTFTVSVWFSLESLPPRCLLTAQLLKSRREKLWVDQNVDSLTLNYDCELTATKLYREQWVLCGFRPPFSLISGDCRSLKARFLPGTMPSHVPQIVSVILGLNLKASMLENWCTQVIFSHLENISR